MMDRKTLWTAAELLDEDFPPIPWVVPGLLTSGLSLLVGAPKLGKSWLALAVGFSVSVGGAVLSQIRVPEHDVLYLALEDTPRRLKSRLEKIGATRSGRLHIATHWTPGTEGVEALRAWLKEEPETKLVVIDTWGRWAVVRDGNDYGQVTAAAAQLKAVADEYDVCILCVHHARKADVSDFLDATLGSTGLAAVADSTLVLRRGRGNRDAVLSATGRDIEEVEYVVHFDSETGTWALRGTTAEVQETDARQQIVDLLAESEPMTPKEVAESLGKNPSTVRTLMSKMADAGVLTSMSGKYIRRPVDSVDRRREQANADTGRVYASTESTHFQGSQGGYHESLN